MSLINRMLRDLSTRAPDGGNVMGGVRPQAPMRKRRSGALAAILLAGVAAFTAIFWFTAPKKLPAPGTRAPGTIAASGVPTPAAATRFRIDATMSPPVGGPAPKRATRHRERPASLAIDESVPSMARGAEPAPKPAGLRDARAAQSRLDAATVALKAGEPSSAERLLREALEADPSLHAAREKLVSLLLDQGRVDEAKSVLDAGLAIEPQRLAFRRLGARIDLARGQPAAARTRLEPAQPPVAEDPEYHGLLASAYQRLNLNEDASREYRALTQAQPADGHWWAGYGLARDALGDAAGALKAYAQARQLGNLEPLLLDHINKRTAALQSEG